MQAKGRGDEAGSAGRKRDLRTAKGQGAVKAKGCFSLVRQRSIIDDYPARSPIQRRYELLQPILDERLRRLWVAAEALALGPGGIAVLSEATGLSRTTIRAGIEELRSSEGELAQLAKEGRVRRPG